MVTIQGRRATFRFLRPQALAVYLAGSFNLWRPDELLMNHSADGFWAATLDLAPGEYSFRYCADGQWFVDYAAFGVEHGPFGLDGVVRIPKAPQVPACADCPHVPRAA
jgi:1,4-alpha-glucan branching enzyme